LQAGPYMGFAVGGKSITEYRGEKIEEKIKFGSGDDDFMKGFDFGTNLSVGWQFGNIQTGLGFSTSWLRSLSNEKNVRMHNIALSLIATYYFGK